MSRTRIGAWVPSMCLSLGLVVGLAGDVLVADPGPSGAASAGPRAKVDAGEPFMLLNSEGSLVRSFTVEKAWQISDDLNRQRRDARFIDILYDSLGDAEIPQSEGAHHYCLTVERDGHNVHMELSSGSIKLTDPNTGESHYRFTRQDARLIETQLRAEGWDRRSIVKLLFGQRQAPSHQVVSKPTEPGTFNINLLTHGPGGGFSGSMVPAPERLEIPCDTCEEGLATMVECNYVWTLVPPQMVCWPPYCSRVGMPRDCAQCNVCN